MKLSLPSNISSPQDLRALIMEIRAYARWSQQVATKMRIVAGVPKTEPMTVSEPAAILIRQAADNKEIDRKTLDELIVGLEEIEAKAPRVVITLAGLAPGSLRQLLVKWCRENLGPDVLVDLRFNATLLGGMVVQYGSHVHDWSFRRQILAGRSKFPEVLRHV
jgi:hypothetical protein